jgi:streptogrisin C
MHALCKKSTPCVQRPSHVLSETPRTLDVLDGADFDVALQRFNGMRWVTVARTRGDSGDETVTFTGRFGIYRYLVTAVSGSGDYTLGYKRP